MTGSLQEDEQHSTDAVVFQLVLDAAAARARGHASRPSREDVEDIAQETAARFAQQDPGSIGSPGAWANVVAGNLCVSYARKRARESGLAVSDDDGREALSSFLLLGSSSSALGMAREQAGLLLGMLTVRERELVSLVVQGLPQGEIASVMGYANADSVKATLQRLRRRITDDAPSVGLDVHWQDHPRPY